MFRRRFLCGGAASALSSCLSAAETRVLRVRLPGVDALELIGKDFRSQSMKAMSAGVFEAELSLPARVNRYRYKLAIGKTTLADPGNPLRLADSERLRGGNVLWHPASLHKDWLSGNIKRGRLERITVVCSRPTPHERAVWVHIPSGYEDRTKGLPALYLLHGGGGSGLSYCLDDCAPDLSDTLLWLGKVRPFLTIMPDLDPTLGSIPENPYSLRKEGLLWIAELQKRVGESAALLKTEIIPAVERRYGLRSDWNSRAIAGNSGGGYHTLMLEADHPAPYAKVLAPSAMFNPGLTRYFFESIDRRPKNASRPRVIVSAGVNDPFSDAGRAQNLGSVDEHCRAFAELAEQHGMLHKLFIHEFGHSGGPEILVEVMEAAWGRRTAR